VEAEKIGRRHVGLRRLHYLEGVTLTNIKGTLSMLPVGCGIYVNYQSAVDRCMWGKIRVIDV
jgi:hypothetical protein